VAVGTEIAWIDTIDVCHLRCPTCIRGVRGIENTPSKMPLEMFERVIAKVKAERYSCVGLYNWTEPFQNRTLQDYVAVVRQAGLSCEISTTLSLRHIDNLKDTLLAGLNRMTVSMSGATQATYEQK
jgi:organic radical activating enzyme